MTEIFGHCEMEAAFFFFPRRRRRRAYPRHIPSTVDGIDRFYSIMSTGVPPQESKEIAHPLQTPYLLNTYSVRVTSSWDQVVWKLIHTTSSMTVICFTNNNNKIFGIECRGSMSEHEFTLALALVLVINYVTRCQKCNGKDNAPAE